MNSIQQSQLVKMKALAKRLKKISSLYEVEVVWEDEFEGIKFPGVKARSIHAPHHIYFYGDFDYFGYLRNYHDLKVVEEAPKKMTKPEWQQLIEDLKKSCSSEQPF